MKLLHGSPSWKHYLVSVSANTGAVQSWRRIVLYIQCRAGLLSENLMHLSILINTLSCCGFSWVGVCILQCSGSESTHSRIKWFPSRCTLSISAKPQFPAHHSSANGTFQRIGPLMSNDGDFILCLFM